MEKRKTYIIVTALFLLYIAAVLCLCLLNLSDKTPELPKYFLGIPMDKLAHFLMFFAYPVTGWLMLTYNKTIKMRQVFIFPVLLITGLLFAAFTETAQGLFTTYREPDNLDFVADAIGILSSTFLIRILQKPLRKLFDSLQEYFHRVL
ncbi:MAG: VanZ family protein [Bacteroidales bacterium]|nr:VanZ family protein [Bacteroidales bacterium]